MDLQALSKEGKISLLTLPRTEFKNNGAEPQVSNDASNDDTAPLLLLQLPKGWTPQDLKDSKFVGSANSAHVALVVESKNASFSLNRLETSNCLVVVPPPQSDSQGPSKKAKLHANGKTILPVPARLLTPGGSGSSFLELREKPLLIHDLQESLKGHILDPYTKNPYNNSIKKPCAGRTVENLAASLQTSQAQLRTGLQALQAFALPRTDPAAYCLLSEEAQLEACNGIVSALSEAEDCQDYAVVGVSVERLVKHVVKSMSAEESYADAEFVIRHCLSTMSAPSESGHGNDKVRLSVGKVRMDSYTKVECILIRGCEESARSTIFHVKLTSSFFFARRIQVAVCVARRLFQKQTAPWEETLFLSRWQSELPGVGHVYQVVSDMLRGVAVDIVADGERFFRYLPCEKLPSDPAVRFHRLFQEKEVWQLPDLEPYMAGLADSLSQSELLLCFTTSGTAEDGSKVYTKK
jgi:hypothetical protein